VGVCLIQLDRIVVMHREVLRSNHRVSWVNFKLLLSNSVPC